MSMTVSAGDDSDELDDDIEQDDDRDDDDREDDDSDRRSKARSRSREDGDDADLDDDEDDLADKTDEELKAEVKRLRAAVAKSNASGQRQRLKVKQLRAAQAALDDRDDTDDDEDEPEAKAKPRREQGLDARAAQRMIDKAVKKREADLTAQHNRDLIDTRMETLLARAGADDKAVRLLKRELDYDELEIDAKTRAVEGAEEEIDRLKLEYPNLFRGSKAARRRVNGGDDRDGGRGKKPMTATERQVAMLQGRGR